jgi:hypothetical protein
MKDVLAEEEKNMKEPYMTEMESEDEDMTPQRERVRDSE